MCLTLKMIATLKIKNWSLISLYHCYPVLWYLNHSTRGLRKILVQDEPLFFFLVLFVLVGEDILPSQLRWLRRGWVWWMMYWRPGEAGGSESSAGAQLSPYCPCLVSCERTWLCHIKSLICSAAVSGESTVLGIWRQNVRWGLRFKHVLDVQFLPLL